MGVEEFGRGEGDGGDAMLAVACHGLLNPISIVIATAETLRAHWDRLDEDRREEFLDNMLRHAKLVAGVIRDLASGLSPEAAALLAELDAEARERFTAKEDVPGRAGRPSD